MKAPPEPLLAISKVTEVHGPNPPGRVKFQTGVIPSRAPLKVGVGAAEEAEALVEAPELVEEATTDPEEEATTDPEDEATTDPEDEAITDPEEEAISDPEVVEEMMNGTESEEEGRVALSDNHTEEELP